MRRFIKTPKNKKTLDNHLSSDQPLKSDILNNISELKKLFKDCSDIVFREFSIKEKKAYLIFVDGLIDTKSLEFNVLFQLLDKIEDIGEINANYFEKNMVTIAQVSESNYLNELVKKVLEGNTVLIIDEIEKAIILHAQGGVRRAVAEPETETSIRGPREGFTESLRVNTSLVRRKIRSNRLKIVSKEVGTETRTALAILYIEGLASDDLVREVLTRIDRIEIDGVLESGYIEELIEDHPWSFFPQIQNTERPDSVAGNLLEGRVAIIIDGTPFVLIAPATFWQFLQASEDYYHRFHISIFLRWLRIVFIFIALQLPAFYVAVTTYHQEMIPTTLLYSIASSREAIPFPAFVEAMIMEIAFEALREAGIRLPKLVGQAVSILGALVIGQAAVEAGIVSAPMVIVVSLTGIASFTVPRFNMAISIRLLRFPMMILAGSFGLFGIVIGSIILLTHLCSLRSFGIPYFSPLGPLSINEFKDVFIRTPWWSMDKRPKNFVHQNLVREKANLKPSPKQDN
ncbi:spore germination protein [Bacillus sp. PS06]|uniref:spore germination protein n=1 Tax=Bacillus sp. PS06 TaxID=2764176 RepID=UPI00177F9F02|nr:spore germination protein [Bacillus sp. PS06]MBD8067970.1 spore germination protein [Bacillus sp. PS06]